MNRIRTAAATILLLLSTVSLGACRIQEVPRPERVDLSEAPREEIRLTLQEWRDALIAGDAEAVADFYTADAVQWAPDEADVIGSRAIAEAMREQFRTQRVTALSLHRESLHVVDGGIAYEMGTFSESIDTAGVPHHVNGRYAIRWRRQPEGVWRIERFLFNFADLAGGDSASLRIPRV